MGLIISKEDAKILLEDETEHKAILELFDKLADADLRVDVSLVDRLDEKHEARYQIWGNTTDIINGDHENYQGWFSIVEDITLAGKKQGLLEISGDLMNAVEKKAGTFIPKLSADTVFSRVEKLNKLNEDTEDVEA